MTQQPIQTEARAIRGEGDRRETENQDTKARYTRLFHEIHVFQAWVVLWAPCPRRHQPQGASVLRYAGLGELELPRLWNRGFSPSVRRGLGWHPAQRCGSRHGLATGRSLLAWSAAETVRWHDFRSPEVSPTVAQ